MLPSGAMGVAPLTATESFDPAADTAPDGRPSLQARLGTWGKVLTLVNIGYWLTWWLTYVGPHGDQTAAGRIAPAAALGCAAYVSLWVIGKGRPRSVAFLEVVDVVGFATIGGAFCAGLIGHPVPPIIAIEALTGMMFILFARALLIPSSPRRTLLVGVLLVLPNLIVAFVLRERFSPRGVSPYAYWVTFATWCTMSCGVCTVASKILYGLRREVHDARRLGQYTLLEKLGQGGMGVVYRASHAMLRRPTAIKLLSAQEQRESQERFEQEVQHMAQISHPHIVTVHDYGRTSRGAFYYAMELLDGLDLERLVQRHGAMPAERVVHVLDQVAKALAHAHAAGLVHRDVKPANIFLCRSWGEPDTVKVLDFGLVKDLRDSAKPTLTQGERLLGTPLYMAPEAVTDPGRIDARADLYAVGAVGYFLLAGQPVFHGRTAIEVTAHHLHTAPTPLRTRTSTPVSERLEQLVSRCLSKTPDERFPHAGALREALHACPEASRWTHEHAAAWWAERDREGAAGTPPVGDSTPFLDTIAIDPSKR